MCNLFLVVIVLLNTGLKYTNGISSENGSCKIGCDVFSDVVNSLCFVDKTDLIKNFFKHKFVLITAPRRFGKSINMNMIQTFCECKVYNNGTTIPKTETDNFKIFSKKYKKTIHGLEHLNVYNDTYFFQRHFGEYPVIYLNFKGLTGSSFKSFIQSFRIMVDAEFRRHKYVLNSNVLKLLPTTFKVLKRYYLKLAEYKLPKAELLDMMKFLSEILFIHFKKKIVVLIDEFDALVQKTVFNGGEDFKEIIVFVRQFIFNLLKSNENVERALLNACVRLAGLLTSDANNTQYFPFLGHHSFNTYFGLTQEEVSNLLVKFKLENETAEVIKWYDGYFLEAKKIKMYSTWSIVNYLQFRELKSYWIDSGYIKNLKKLVFYDQIRVKILEMLDSRTVQIAIVEIENVEIKHTRTLEKIFECQLKFLDDSEADLFLQFMTDSGYFDIIRVTSFHMMKKKISAYIKIPNNEIFFELTAKVYNQKLFKLRFNFDPKYISAFKVAVLSLGDASSFKQLLKTLNQLLRKRKALPVNEAELAHAVFSKLKEEDCFASLNLEGPLEMKTSGRKTSADVILARHDGVGIIFELKCQNPKSQGKVSAVAALNQSLSYYKLFDHDNYKKHVTSDKILIGVYMTAAGKFSICYLVNNQKLENKICVFY